jgi:hypothetical protein
MRAWNKTDPTSLDSQVKNILNLLGFEFFSLFFLFFMFAINAPFEFRLTFHNFLELEAKMRRSMAAHYSIWSAEAFVCFFIFQDKRLGALSS